MSLWAWEYLLHNLDMLGLEEWKVETRASRWVAKSIVVIGPLHELLVQWRAILAMFSCNLQDDAPYTPYLYLRLGHDLGTLSPTTCPPLITDRLTLSVNLGSVFHCESSRRITIALSPSLWKSGAQQPPQCSRPRPSGA